MRNTWTSSFVI